MGGRGEKQTKRQKQHSYFFCGAAHSSLVNQENALFGERTNVRQNRTGVLKGGWRLCEEREGTEKSEGCRARVICGGSEKSLLLIRRKEAFSSQFTFQEARTVSRLQGLIVFWSQGLQGLHK